MFKKIEIWIVGLIVIFFILLILFVSGVLRDAYLGKNRTPEFLRNNFVTIAEIPKNIYHVINHLIGDNINSPPKLHKHKDKKRFEEFVPYKRNALLVLPRYDHSLSRSVVDIVDLNNFEVIHTYKHDIAEMNKKVTNTKEFPRIKIDHSPIRFIYQHPLLLSDFSIVSNSNYSIEFKIDFCSNLKWINDEEIFHHSNMLDHEGNIWVAGQYNPYSKLVAKYKNKNRDFVDDSIIKINTDGKILQKKSVTEILIENKLATQFIFESFSSDPIHLNDIEPALNDSKYWKKGDLFLSLPILSEILHYRPKTNKIINYITGPFAEQHDVDIISDKEISIFNNNNFVVDNEQSEVVIYNFETKKFRTLFNDQLKKNKFKTTTEGLSHIFKDGSLMVEEQNHGRIILFNNQGEKEWVFVNKDKNGDIGHISWSRIIEDEIFIEKFKSLVDSKKCTN
tara:strand:+ start:163 stop:1512 length:1350 start_codon:yes stop_codon:yes gene_type:complete